MKKMFFYITLFVSVLMVVTSCSSKMDDDSEYLQTKSTTKKDTIPTPTPDPDTTEVWNQVMAKSFTVLPSKDCKSVITLQSNKGNTKEFNLEYIFGIELNAPSRIYTDNPNTYKAGLTGAAKSIANRTRQGSDSIWTVTTPWEAKTNLWSINIKTTRKEGLLQVSGKWESYESATESVTYTDFKSQDLGEVAEGDSIYKVERCTSSFRISLKSESWEVVSVTDVYRFVRVKTTEPEPQNMPDPDKWVDGIKSVSTTMSPEFTTLSGNDNIRAWHVVALVTGGKAYYIFVDGKFVKEESVSGQEGCNSAFYAEGAWHPAQVETKLIDGVKFFRYAFKVGGDVKTKLVDEKLALNSGMKTFEKSSNAAQTWALKTYSEKKVYADGTWMKIWCQNNGAKVYTFTVGVKN